MVWIKQRVGTKPADVWWMRRHIVEPRWVEGICVVGPLLPIIQLNKIINDILFNLLTLLVFGMSAFQLIFRMYSSIGTVNCVSGIIILMRSANVNAQIVKFFIC